MNIRESQCEQNDDVVVVVVVVVVVAVVAIIGDCFVSLKSLRLN